MRINNHWDRSGDGDCYEAALKLAIDMMLEERTGKNGKRKHYRVVHGLVVHPITGLRHGHAWVECLEVVGEMPDGRPMHLDMVLDKSNGNDNEMPRALYYLMGGIEEDDLVRYEQAEMRKNVLLHDHCGPWHVEATA